MERDSQLVLPVSGTQLGHFISSLLGQRRTIQNNFSLPCLMVRYEWILNIVEVLNQRISQNKHAMASFKCLYYFASGKVIIVYDIDSFRSFNDSSQDETVGVDLNLTYLVQFSTSTIPEKQDVRIEVFSNAVPRDYPGTQNNSHDPLLRYTIHTTNLTWGEDISNHINNNLPSIVRRDMFQKLADALKKVFPILVLIAFPLALFGAGIDRSVRGDDKIAYLSNLMREINDVIDLNSIDMKLDILLKGQIFESKVDWIGLLHSPRPYALSLCAGLLFISWLLIARFGKVYIVASNKFTTEKLERVIKTREYIMWAVFVSLAVGTVAGVVGARLDTFLFSGG